MLVDLKGPLHASLSLSSIALTVDSSCFNPLKLPGPSPPCGTPPLCLPPPRAMVWKPSPGRQLELPRAPHVCFPPLRGHGLELFDVRCLRTVDCTYCVRVLIVSGGRISLVPVIPSWPEVKVHQIFAEGPVLTKCQGLLNGKPSSVHSGRVGGQNPAPLASGKAAAVRKEKADVRNQCISHGFVSVCSAGLGTPTGWGILNSSHSFSLNPGGCKSQIKVSAELVSPLRLVDGHLLPSYMACPLSVSSSPVLSAASLMDEGPPL